MKNSILDNKIFQTTPSKINKYNMATFGKYLNLGHENKL